MSKIHHYKTQCNWKGSTALGYENYNRTHTLKAEPVDTTLTVSADPSFRGNKELLNPEQLLLMAASSCQLLSFLALAARARLDIRSYDDEAEAVMPEEDKPIRITHITLRPKIVVAGNTTAEKVTQLVQQAHKHCFIANSLTSAMTIEPTVEIIQGF